MCGRCCDATDDGIIWEAQGKFHGDILCLVLCSLKFCIVVLVCTVMGLTLKSSNCAYHVTPGLAFQRYPFVDISV